MRVIRDIRHWGPYKYRVLAECDCGRLVRLVRYELTRHTHSTRSCGCKTRDIARTRLIARNKLRLALRHGQACTGKRTVEYRAWAAARSRCNNPNPKAQGFKNYRGRGIRFLFISFEQFFAELGRRPKGLSLDRIENDGNYEPGNVRWAGRKMQSNNQRERS